MLQQLSWLIGLITFVSTALIGQAELLGEPWRHYVTVLAIIGTAITAYMLQHPPPPWDGVDRRSRKD